MNVVCKTIKGQEFLVSREYSILCSSEKQAEALADFLNSHNETSNGNFKLRDNETWHVYQLDNYDYPPQYKLKTMRGKISVTRM